MKTLSLLFVALLLCACATPYRPPQLVDADTSFPGLIDLAAQSGTADVLLVHGICTHDATWARLVVSQLMRSVDAVTSAPATARVDGGPQVQVVPSTVETTFRRWWWYRIAWAVRFCSTRCCA